MFSDSPSDYSSLRQEPLEPRGAGPGRTELLQGYRSKGKQRRAHPSAPPLAEKFKVGKLVSAWYKVQRSLQRAQSILRAARGAVLGIVK